MPGYLHFSQRFCILMVWQNKLALTLLPVRTIISALRNAGQVFCAYEKLTEPEEGEDRSEVCRNDGVCRPAGKSIKNRLSILPHITQRTKDKGFYKQLTGKAMQWLKEGYDAAQVTLLLRDYCTPEAAVRKREIVHRPPIAASYAFADAVIAGILSGYEEGRHLPKVPKCVVHRRNNANGIYVAEKDS